jgi:hypothetical protein
MMKAVKRIKSKEQNKITLLPESPCDNNFNIYIYSMSMDLIFCLCFQP